MWYDLDGFVNREFGDGMVISFSNIFAGAIFLFQYFFYFLYFRTDDHLFLFFYFFFNFFVILYLMLFKGKSLLLNFRQDITYYLKCLALFVLFVLFSFLSINYEYYINLYNLVYAVTAFLSAYLLFQMVNAIFYVKIMFWLYFLVVLYYFL
ncbi:MAG: hypothetical protein Q4E77_07115, partial [Conchiformibius sp.]|nr:hypothetical protein [Conchiformibius sp.]